MTGSSDCVRDEQPAVTRTPAKADPVHQDPAEPPTGTNGHPRPQENGSSAKFELLQQWHSQPRKLRVIHVGAGATGLCAAFKMERQLTEYELVCYDENEDVGGTWLKSRYPGCACDVPAHIYTYTFEPNPDWSSYYACGPEIHKYFVGFCDKYGLRKYIKLRHRVLGATWHEDKAQWEVTVEHDGQTFTDWCHILVNGSGLLNKYRWPDIEGLHSFKGPLMHSADWDDSVDYSGKRVAVLGNGSSAIQIIPQVQKVASQVKCFMRGSTWISAPMSRVPVEVSNGGNEVVEDKGVEFPDVGQYFYTEREKNHLASNPEYLLEYRKRIETDISLGFAIFYKDSEASRMAEQYMKTEMKRRLKDHPILTQKLIPGWPVGCRRLTPGDGYLEALLEPNVNTTFSEISSISETGLVTSDGVSHEVDVIVCATGYDIAWTPHFNLIGRRGRDIKDAWSPTPKCWYGADRDLITEYLIMASQLSPDDPVFPPWGWFPAEQFIIRRWDAASSLSAEEQRRNLLHSFMKTDVLVDGWTVPGDAVSRVPTVEEVRDILAPWRPQKIRKIAHRYLGRSNQYIILRTYYGQDSEDKMAAILEDEEDGDESVDPENNWWRVLDDAQLFDFGDEWQRVFEILPELVGHRGQQIHRGLSETRITSIRQLFAEFEQEDTLDQVSPIIDQIQKSAAAANGPLFVADEWALEEKLLEVFYLDGYGNVVRHSATEPGNMGDMRVREEVSRDVDCWSDGKIGPLYKGRGEMAARYYPQSE